MNQEATGKFIALKRKEKNLTQEQLAERLGISNKTVSKWECGKCMPDYNIIEPLCRELDITVSELMTGVERKKEKNDVFEDMQLLDMLERIQCMERQKLLLFGMVLISVGIAVCAVSRLFGGSQIQDFVAGVLLGLSVGQMLIGIYIVASMFRKNK